MSKFWGYHLILDVAACDIESVTNGTKIAEFARELVKKINMKAYGEPQVVHFADHDAEKAGYTLIQLIETSNITAHFCDIDGNAYIDVFSCLQFDNEIVKQVVTDYFNPKSIRETYLIRQA